jgi:hypothetical protein
VDIIKINVPAFLRILELVRENVKDDPDLHDIAEIVTVLSQDGVISMKDYNTIVNYMKTVGNDKPESDTYENEIQKIRKLGGID